MRFFQFFTVISLTFFLTACQQANTSATSHLKITTTTGMIADAAKAIGGEHVRVTTLMGSGIDPHVYKATQGDIKRLREADVIFYNGLHLEAKLSDILQKLSRLQTVVAITDNLDTQLLKSQGQADPHIWFDILLWRDALKQIQTTLCTAQPMHCDDFQANYNAYASHLTELHAWTTSQINTIPKTQRVLITAHDAFGYFGRAYAIDVVGLQGISTATEFGLQDIKRVQNIIIKRNIKAVFIENSVPKKFIESLQAGLAVQDHHIVIGGELFSDAMGAEGTPESTYLGMVKHNVTTITNALK